MIASAAGNAVFGQSYDDNATLALESLAVGNSKTAFDAAKAIVLENSGDLLARNLLAVSMAFGGRLTDAEVQADYVLSLDPENAEAACLKGLIALAQKNYDEAAEYFEYTASGEAGLYTVYLTGKKPEGSDSDICAAAKAIAATGDEALTAWKDLQGKVIVKGFGEQPGFTATFDRTKPVKITGDKLDSRRVFEHRIPRSVKGILTLKADVPDNDVSMVMFTVDGRPVCTTNVPPYTFELDTSDFANGFHTVGVCALDNMANTVNEKTSQVFFANENPKAVPYGGKPEYRAALLKILTLRVSAATVNFNVAKNTSGDERTIALERVLAADPEYPGAKEMILACYGAGAKYDKIEKLPTDRRVAILTFDDGPREITETLLGILKEKNVKATHFMVGKQMEMFPETVKAFHEDGQDVENHTYSHFNILYLTESEITQQLFKGIAVCRSITGKRMRFMRPPGGHDNPALPKVLKTYGITPVYWTVLGSKFEGTSVDRYVNEMVSRTNEGGSVVLMHGTESITLSALPMLIDKLREKGFEFDTISNLVYGNTQ